MPKKYWGNAKASQAFANSPAGVKYALGRMAQSGAAGLSGADAVETIIRRFERPADPDASVRNALGRMGAVGSDRPRSPAIGGGQPVQFGGQGIDPAQIRKAFSSYLLDSMARRSTGQAPDFGGLMQLAQQRKQMMASQEAFGSDPEAQANRWGGTTRPGGEPGDSPVINKILAAAHSQIGKPYVWGAESPKVGFDCSGLIDWAYQQAGVDLPGRLTTYSARQLGQPVKNGQWRPGDMLITNGGEHMVMYVGNGRVIAAPRRGEVVQYQDVSRFKGDIVDVRRVI